MHLVDGPDGYAYDVFVSHRREPVGEELLTPWIKEVVRRVRLWLGMSLGGVEARVFFDVEVLKPGSRWPTALQQAIGASRCLLPIWSPAYFRSAWCLAEWHSFLARERIVGGGASLVVPLSIHDGQWFPPEAKQVECLDISRYAATTGAFWDTRRADELDIVLRGFADDLARAVVNAPAFQPEWPVQIDPPAALPLPVDLPMVDA